MTVNFGQALANAGLYLGIPFVLFIFFGMYTWEKTCRKKIRVWLIKAGGGVESVYVAKEGGDVTIPNPATGVTRTWPISALATIPTPYPELGILPRFLQREIQTAILNEGDWEPVLNRNPHRDKIMSPDAAKFMLGVADSIRDKHPDIADSITEFLGGISTGPTREMIGDPAVLGALKVSSVMRALATVSDDLLEALKGIRNQLARFAGLNATYVYIGLGLIIVLLGFNLYFTIQAGQADVAELAEKVESIRNALGIQ